MIKHKEALHEIFTAKMASGQSLYQKVDEILKASIVKLPTNVFEFICLGDFVTVPTTTGRLKDKYLVVTQDIICGSTVKERKKEGEVEAEEKAWEMAKLVRTILRDNQTLTSTTYPTGVARKTYINEAPQEFVLYYDTQCCVHTILLEIHLHEDDS